MNILDSPELQAIGRARPVDQFLKWKQDQQAIKAGETANQLNEISLRDAQRKEQMDNFMIPLEALSEKAPNTVGPDGEPLPNATDPEMEWINTFADTMKDGNGNPVVQYIGGKKSIPNSAYRFARNLIIEDAKVKGELSRSYNEKRIQGMVSKVVQANEEIAKLVEKNPNISDQQFTKDASGMQTENPNYDEKYANLVRQRNQSWTQAQQIHQMLNPKQDTTRTKEEIFAGGTEQEKAGIRELIQLENEAKKKAKNKPLLNNDDYVIAAQSLGITDLTSLTKEDANAIIEKVGQIKENVAKRTQSAKTSEQVIMVQNADGSYALVNKGTKTGADVKNEGGDKIYKSPPSEIRVMNSALTDNLNSASEVRKAFSKGLVGPVTGTVKKFGTKFYNDKDFTTLKNRVGQLRTIIYGLSGKQINEAEYKWLTNEIIPNIQNPDENFITTLDEFEAWVKRKQGSIHSEYPALDQNKKMESTGQTSSGNRFTVKEIK